VEDVASTGRIQLKVTRRPSRLARRARPAARPVGGRTTDDGRLADAIKGALREVTDDMRLTGLWIAAYGLVVAAAAASTERRYTPAEVWNRARGWVERRRQTTWGTILLGVLGLFISLVFIQEPLGQPELPTRAAGRLFPKVPHVASRAA